MKKLDSYSSIEAIKKANDSLGRHFFETGTMRFFNSRVLGSLYSGRVFVTSERRRGSEREYTVRMCVNGDIVTVGEFQAFSTARKARHFAEMIGQIVASATSQPLDEFVWDHCIIGFPMSFGDFAEPGHYPKWCQQLAEILELDLRWTVKATARKAGALGIFYQCTWEGKATSESDAREKFAAEYERGAPFDCECKIVPVQL